MTKEELLTYKDGEKAVEIQEFQIGATDDICSCQLVYKATIYSNIKKGFFVNVKYDKYSKLLIIYNKKIDIENQILDKLNELKKGLMQSMFV